MYNTSRQQVDSLIEKLGNKKQELQEKIDIYRSKNSLEPMEKEKLRRLDKEFKICDYLIDR